ncbi:cell division protein DivIVA [Cohnella kolymensis]|uniref:Cell division protein DivIVA n=1 Tax=Cohnella kolymensis TaxID=1590652 RepID=A0ABR5A9B1_9BACL|nr:DUF2203 domain-containing protein [Cohnella kolymensis]KIL37507.1 cell division protein DivIVA [Cohnella kolymensis]
MQFKTFTLNEANALLPEIKENLLKLQAMVGAIEARHSDLQKKKAMYKQSPVSTGAGKDDFFKEESALDFMRMEAELLLSNFARKGVQLKMIDPGLIDFPAVWDGNDVLLCWKQGEERITHYHGWNDGFMGRKPIPEGGTQDANN